MGFAHWLDNFSSLMFLCTLVVCIISWVIGLTMQIKYRKETDFYKKIKARKIFFVTLLVFAGGIGFMFLTDAIIVSQARNEVLPQLANEILSVQVNGKPSQNSLQLINDLRRLNTSTFRYHHSHPTTSIPVSLQTKDGDLELILARDSGDREEYWVFYPQYQVTTMNDIGKITTAALDGF